MFTKLPQANRRISRASILQHLDRTIDRMHIADPDRAYFGEYLGVLPVPRTRKPSPLTSNQRLILSILSK
jgi:hypothetical protein